MTKIITDLLTNSQQRTVLAATFDRRISYRRSKSLSLSNKRSAS